MALVTTTVTAPNHLSTSPSLPFPSLPGTPSRGTTWLNNFLLILHLRRLTGNGLRAFHVVLELPLPLQRF